ncbi:hypothetical protein [Streptomyces spectabilis]|nr:hypothetical protein [Streptomyces spectabilis]MBB5102968.1 hypothetical protein [Streptomyces spectabilis]MCI3902167.1 hypothetical protein [Streptomyces spectabilis]GGV15585.1 hypothetical protein GCM10010245_26970 [Streptomyces spectabilis]
MADQEHKEDATRVAIEFLMLWMSEDRQAAAVHIAEVLHGDTPSDPAQVIAGLLNLNMLTIFELARTQGTQDHRAWAEEYLQQRSLRLPKASD